MFVPEVALSTFCALVTKPIVVEVVLSPIEDVNLDSDFDANVVFVAGTSTTTMLVVSTVPSDLVRVVSLVVV